VEAHQLNFWKTAREVITYIGTPIWKTAELFSETMEHRGSGTAFLSMRKKMYWLLWWEYPSGMNEGKVKVFSDYKILREFVCYLNTFKDWLRKVLWKKKKKMIAKEGLKYHKSKKILLSHEFLESFDGWGRNDKTY
jgi:hypothetical protein